jgi:hypothetical protein
MHRLYHVVAPRLPITWLLSHLTDFCREIRSWDRNQKVKRSQLALFSCHVHQIWGWNNIFDNVYFENTLFGPFTLKYTFYKNCHFLLSGTVPSLLCSEYPFVWFWTKDKWKAFHATTKDSSEVSTGNAQDNSVIGTNKSMAYIEQDDGTLVSSDMAVQIHHFAQSIWRGYSVSHKFVTNF